MNDEDFARGFRKASLAQFHHRDHLRLISIEVARVGPEAALDAIRAGIQNFAAHHGQSDKYHETITRFWVELFCHVMKSTPEAASFDELLAAHPELLDKSMPRKHWSGEAMAGSAARTSWVPPDLRALPW